MDQPIIYQVDKKTGELKVLRIAFVTKPSKLMVLHYDTGHDGMTAISSYIEEERNE